LQTNLAFELWLGVNILLSTTMAEEEQKQDQVPVSSSTVSDDEPTTTYPGGIKLALITIALCLTVFLVALASSL
jgi:hypothetical protein